MSLFSLPIVILNLGGEMFYVLDQRLKAQKIPSDRAQKVLNEIAAMMLDQRFLEQIFKPQSLYNKNELYMLFREIAHASIMKLNDMSMGKLYDLMVMVFKYQLYFATQPRDLLLISLNHLDSLRELINSPNIQKQLDVAYFLLMQTYYPMSESRLQRIRYDILNYFQDVHIKVSIFLRLGQQNDDGIFVTPSNECVPNGIEPPGIIKVYHKDGSVKDIISFSPGGDYSSCGKGNFELKGKRSTLLGTSIYQEKSNVQDFTWCCGDNFESQIMRNMDIKGVYSSELETLMIQLRREKIEEKDEHIFIDLFSTALDPRKEVAKEHEITTVTLNDDERKLIPSLETAVSDMKVDFQTRSSNLLDLLENIE